MKGGQTRTAGGARTLPARYYTSDEVFRAEMERIFARRWLYAGRRTRLREPGSFFLYEIDKESLILLQDRTGKPRAFFNVCRHRGTRICSETSGLFSGTIRCPYHGWSYDLDGSLAGAPNMQDVAGFDRSDYPLKAASLEAWDGGLFVNLAADPEPLDRAFAPLIDKFNAWRVAELVVAHRITYDVKANWKLVFQNYSECYHCPTLHPALNRLTPYRNTDNDLLEGPFLGGPMKLAEDNGSMTMSGARCAPPLGDVSGEDLNLVYYYTISPTMLLSLNPDYVLVHRIQPLAADRTLIDCEWLFHPDAVSRDGFDPSEAVEFWNTTNTQDWEVSEKSQLGIASRAYTPGPYSELESMIAAWDREYLRALGEV